MSQINKLANILYLHLPDAQSDGWLSKEEVVRRGQEVGCGGDSASVRLRELERDRMIEKRTVNGFVQYRYLMKFQTY